MRGDREDVRQLRVRDERTHRNAVRNRLREREEVGLDVIALPREPRARAAHAALDLVADEKQVLLVAERAQALEELGVGRRHAALALDRLDHHRDRLLVDRGLDGLEVVVVGVREADRQRVVALLAPGLRRRGDRRERTAVEALAERDNLVAAAVLAAPLARQLDRRLIRLGARVAEEDLAAEARELDELRGELRRRLVREEVRRVRQLRRLVPDRLHHLRMAVADIVHADAGREVVEDETVDVTHGDALAAREHDRRRIGRHDGALVLVEDVLGLVAHSVISVPTPSRVNISKRSECAMRPSTR